MSDGHAVPSRVCARVAYADPPYPGMSDFYKDHPDYAGEVDHAELLARLNDYDGWILHTASVTLAEVLALCPAGTRVGAWVKSFASFKKNVRVAYAWEPVLFWPCRARPEGALTITDWISCPITLQRGLVGVKPDKVIRWALEITGVQPTDEVDDLYPGSGAVGDCWNRWRSETRLAV